MSRMSETFTSREIPPSIAARRLAWFKLWKRATAAHYLLGITGVVASTVAAMNLGSWSRFAAAVSGACIATIGFARPETRYAKFVRAWRNLDVACIRFEFGEVDSKA